MRVEWSHAVQTRRLMLLSLLLACDGASGPGSGFTGLDPVSGQVAAGASHNCLLDGAGHAICWGRASDGQLGGDSTPVTAGPAPVSGGRSFTSIAAGESHTCGLTPLGEAWCWGSDRNGQLGLGAPSSGACPLGPCATAPAKVAGNLTLTLLAASGDESCGLTATGVAWCWGLNTFGQLGAPAADSCPDGACSRTPVMVSGGHHFDRLSVSSNGHVCGLTTEGSAWCWGLNHHGQLGVDSVFEYTEHPGPVAGGHRFRQLSAGGLHTCALTGDGVTWCWGIDVLPPRNAGDLTYHHPNRVATSLRFSSIESVRYAECGLVDDGSAYCWGSNSAGELGTTPVGSTVHFDTPVAAAQGQLYGVIVGESQGYCGVALAGGVYCWGAGTSGQLGSGTSNSTGPLRVPGT